MIGELDSVVFAEDLPEHGLKQGDICTGVLIHRAGRGYEAEFVTLNGETVAVVSLSENRVRMIRSGELAHARALA